MEVAHGHLQLGSDLGLARRTSQRPLQACERLLDRPGHGADGTGHPVDRSQLVEDRPLDAGNGVRLETQIAVELEPLDCVDEPDDAVADEIIFLEVLWQPGQHTAGDVLDEWRVVDDQFIAKRL